MENFEFHMGTKFIFGKGVTEGVGAALKEKGAKKVLLHYGGESAQKSGLLSKIEKSLSDAGISFVKLGGVVPNPESAKVYEAIKLCKAERVDFILAAGGGSVIDSAKAIAIGAVCDNDFWDFYIGKAQLKSALPVATVLTIPAAGSEGSESSVITHTDGMVKRGLTHTLLRPVLSFLDPTLVFTLSKEQRAYGIADMTCHIFERYFTNTPACDVTTRLAEGLLLAIIENARKAVFTNDYDAMANIMWAGTSAHNDTVGVGRVQDWGSHQIEHEISALYPKVAHGAGLAVIFPAWLKYVCSHNYALTARLGRNVFGVTESDDKSAAQATVRAVSEFYTSIGLKSTLKDLGVKREDLPVMTKRVNYDEQGQVSHFVRLGQGDVLKIYESCIE